MATSTKKEKPRHTHRWRYRWDRTVRTCKCGSVSWYWHCERRWCQKVPEGNLTRHAFGLSRKALGRWDAETKEHYLGIGGIRSAYEKNIWHDFERRYREMGPGQDSSELLASTRLQAGLVWGKTIEELQQIS